MSAGPPVVSSVRKKLRSVGPCAPTHIVDGFVGNASVSELKADERREVTVRLRAFSSDDDRAAAGGVFYLASNFVADLERIDPDVRSDCDDQLCRLVSQRFHRERCDPGNGAPPARMNRCDVPSRGMRDQDRHAVGGPRSNGDALDARYEPIALFICRGLGRVGGGNFPHPRPMNLALLKQAAANHPEAASKARTVLADRVVLVTQVKAEVECIEGRRADSAGSSRERMHETVSGQERGTQHGHRRLV